MTLGEQLDLKKMSFVGKIAPNEGRPTALGE